MRHHNQMTLLHLHQVRQESPSSNSATRPCKSADLPHPKNSSELRPTALLLTWFVASVPCLAGNLDAITPIITMFFLLMYATINVSCFAVAFLGTPGFRPTWRCFHWSSACLGCLLCLGLMFAISWLYSLVALAFGAGVGFYVRSRRVSARTGATRERVSGSKWLEINY